MEYYFSVFLISVILAVFGVAFVKTANTDKKALLFLSVYIFCILLLWRKGEVAELESKLCEAERLLEEHHIYR